jgi:hypothetical protein
MRRTLPRGDHSRMIGEGSCWYCWDLLSCFERKDEVFVLITENTLSWLCCLLFGCGRLLWTQRRITTPPPAPRACFCGTFTCFSPPPCALRLKVETAQMIVEPYYILWHTGSLSNCDPAPLENIGCVHYSDASWTFLRIVTGTQREWHMTGSP